MLPPSLAALAAQPQFIIVKLVPGSKPGKTDKLPVDWRTGQVATAHDPACWMPLQQAEQLLPMYGAGHCLGFVLREGCGLWCLDVDNCLVEGKWSTTAERLFALLPGAAVELSLSGQGLHFWGSGPVPPHKSKCVALGLELYTELRFIALTGHVLQGDAGADCTAGLQQLVAACFAPDVPGAGAAPDAGPVPEWRGPLDDEELLRRALRSTSASNAFGGRASFHDLWTADAAVLARCYPSSTGGAFDASSADAALAQHLAFWTGRDHARIRALMARSGLARDKWSREDYLDRTVAGACGRQVQVLQDAPSAEHVVAAMAAQTNEQVAGTWAQSVQALPAAEQQVVMAHVANRMAVPVTQLRGELQAVTAASTASVVTQQAGERLLLEVSPSAPHLQAAQVEQAILEKCPPGSYVLFGGIPSQVAVRTVLGAEVVAIERLNEADVHKLAAVASAFYKTRKGGAQEIVEHPPAVLRILQHQTNGVHAPAITGVIGHPVVLATGAILTTPGIDPTSGLFATPSAAVQGCRPYNQQEAAEALQWLRANVFAGFAFASRADEDIALAGLLGFNQRRVLDLAPGFAALANHQMSGKTTLCRVLHLAITGRELPVMSLPVGESEEVEKALVSSLLGGPEAVCFDNVRAGSNFHSRVLSQAMTATRFDARVLGASRIVSCPTNVFVMLSGNNLSLGMDESSRWSPCNLITRDGSGPSDIAGHILGLRETILRHLVGITAGYLAADVGSLGPASRFVQWDRMVRFPLMWAGAGDAAMGFVANEAAGQDQNAVLQLLQAIARAYPERAFSVTDISKAITGMDVSVKAADQDDLRESLEMLGVRKPDDLRLLSHRLGEIVRRPVAGLLLDRDAGLGRKLFRLRHQL